MSAGDHDKINTRARLNSMAIVSIYCIFGWNKAIRYIKHQHWRPIMSFYKSIEYVGIECAKNIALKFEIVYHISVWINQIKYNNLWVMAVVADELAI